MIEQPNSLRNIQGKSVSNNSTSDSQSGKEVLESKSDDNVPAADNKTKYPKLENQEELQLFVSEDEKVTDTECNINEQPGELKCTNIDLSGNVISSKE